MAEDIGKLRKRIDEIDDSILKLYEERMRVVEVIGKYKIENDLPVYDEKREDEKLDRVFADVTDKRFADGAAQLFITLMQASREFQEDMVAEEDA